MTNQTTLTKRNPAIGLGIIFLMLFLYAWIPHIWPQLRHEYGLEFSIAFSCLMNCYALASIWFFRKSYNRTFLLITALVLAVTLSVILVYYFFFRL